MKDLKSLKSTEICIRATKKTFDEIIELFEKVGGSNVFSFTKNGSLNGEVYYINGEEEIKVTMLNEIPEDYTELTLSELQEYVNTFLAGVKEPQTDEDFNKEEYKDMYNAMKNSSYKAGIENAKLIGQKTILESELTKLKSENESLKECLKEAIEIINLAINGTPSGMLRNKLTDKNIYIQTKAKTLLK